MKDEEKRQIRLQGQVDALEIKVEKLMNVMLDLLRILYLMLGRQNKVQELGEQLKSWNQKADEKAESKQAKEVSHDKKGKAKKGSRKG